MAKKCPLCGGKVVYEGVVAIECIGDPGCKNYSPPKTGDGGVTRSCLQKQYGPYLPLGFDAWLPRRQLKP